MSRKTIWMVLSILGIISYFFIALLTKQRTPASATADLPVSLLMAGRSTAQDEGNPPGLTAGDPSVLADDAAMSALPELGSAISLKGQRRDAAEKPLAGELPSSAGYAAPGPPTVNWIASIDHPCDPPYRDAAWLLAVNELRQLSNLSPVTENPQWSYEACLHSLYMTKNDYVGHAQDPQNAWYSAGGAAAASSSNALGSSDLTTTDEASILIWASAPYHLIPILRPGLRQTGFGSYQELSGEMHFAAALDVLRGQTGDESPQNYPVKFPAAGQHHLLASYGGGESPDPLVNCPGYKAPSGAPIVLLLGEEAQLGSHRLVRDGIEQESCAFATSDAVVIMPRSPLVSAVYQVYIETNNQQIEWTFYYGRSGCSPQNSGACGGASASGVLTPPRAFDQDYETYFQGSYDEDSWLLTYNYGAPQAMRSLTIQFFDERFTPASSTLSVSLDGVRWQPFAALTGDDTATVAIDGKFQYIQLEMQGRNPQSGFTPAVREIVLLADQGPPAEVLAPASPAGAPVCRRSATSWAAAARLQPGGLEPLLPFWLGTPDRPGSLAVSSVANLLPILEQVNSNGINLLTRSLAAARLNIAAGAEPGELLDVIAAADELLSRTSADDWPELGLAAQNRVGAWVQALIRYNHSDLCLR